MDDCTVNEATPADQAGTKVVTVNGSMTIQHGGEIKSALMQALKTAKTVLLNLEQVTEIDIIGLQLICSTHRASIIKRKRFSVIKAGNEAIEAAAQAMGFCRRTGCIEDTEHTCVWAEGGK
jgi:anti-anti-sigma regulatory factor